MRLGVSILGTIAAFAAAPLVIAAILSRSFIYHPTAMPPAELERIARVPGWELARLEADRGVSLNGFVRPPKDRRLPWVVFFGGNAMDLSAGQWVLERIEGERGYGLAVFAYRGYDGSGGSPSEAALLHDAEAVAAFLEDEHGAMPDALVLVGQSLGSGIAAHLAAALTRDERPPRGLALLSPYTDMGRVFDDHFIVPIRWAVRDRYATERLTDDLQGPVIIVHGEADDLISPDHGRALADALGERARLVLLPRAGHNDLWEDPATVLAIRHLLEEPFQP